MKDRIKRLRTTLEQQKGQAAALRSQKQAAEERSRLHKESYLVAEEAQAIIQLVAKKTQDQLRYRIEEPVSLALSAVFDSPYRLRMEFPVRRGRTECDMIWMGDGKEYSNLEYSDGGGALDVAAFGLQIAVLALMKNRARPILILDEPLKWLKGEDLPERGALMMKEISKELGVQILMVSHIPEQKAGSDKVFSVLKGTNGVSIIKEA